MEYQTFRKEFSCQLQNISHQKLMNLMKELRTVTKERYGGGQTKKCELVERGFTDNELKLLMKVVDDPIDKICFTFMAVLGLRVGELTALKGRDLEGDQLRIPCSKGGYGGVLQLPSSLLPLVPCVDAGEPLFQRTSKQLRDRFAIYRQKANLDDVYCYTEPCGRGGVCNPRYRLSLHSIRHFAIQRIYRKTKDPDLARRFARHKKLETTLEYLKSSRKKELEQILEQVCEPQTIKALEVKPRHDH